MAPSLSWLVRRTAAHYAAMAAVTEKFGHEETSYFVRAASKLDIQDLLRLDEESWDESRRRSPEELTHQLESALPCVFVLVCHWRPRGDHCRDG